MKVNNVNVFLEEKDCVLARRENTYWKRLPTDVVIVYLGEFTFVLSLDQTKELSKRIKQALEGEGENEPNRS